MNTIQNFFLHYGDMTDSTNLIRILQEVQPCEIYNMAAQSHVQVSFESPEYTLNADGGGTLRLLEAIRILNLKNCRFYQASTSELFGLVQETPQRETTPFYPRSPYGVAKLYAYWITKNYRESYGIFASNGILFNHESPLRGETFVTRKITRAVARIHHGFEDCLYIGNLDAMRDWGHAQDYVEGMWRILQHSNPDDFILSTNRVCSVRDFIKMAFSFVGTKIEFSGHATDEIGRCSKTNRVLIRVDSGYYRPAEVDYLQGDFSKAKKLLGWQPTFSLEQLCKHMVHADLLAEERKSVSIPSGFRTMTEYVMSEEFMKKIGI
jgi:GDPmannose 4,6-dehydratase